MRALIIINPAAGDALAPERLTEIQTWISRGGIHADVAETTPNVGAALMAREAVAEGFELIIAAGGDGTVSEVAKELVGKTATLAILPVGTFNNIARSIGIMPDVQQACGWIAHGETREIDVGVAAATHYFFEAAGVGLDATLFPIGEEIKGGRWIRMFEAARLTFAYPRLRFTIELADGRKFQRRALLVVVANGPYYGSGFTVAPEARMRDGTLTVSIYRKFSKLQLARHFWSISRGRYHYSPNIETLKSPRVTISTRQPRPVHIDGVPFGQTPITLECRPRALRVIVPKHHVDAAPKDAPVALPAEHR